MEAPRGLAELQSWMLEVVTHPSGPEAESVNSDGELDRVITSSQRQSSAERLAVYANAYYARLMQCLRELFPATRSAVGDDAFDDFAFGYLQAHPPRSYTLGRLADHFVDYLEQTRQEEELDPTETRRARRNVHETEIARASIEGGDSVSPPCPSFDAWSRFVIELARFEQVIDDVFDGPGLEGLTTSLGEQLAACPPAELGGSRLVPAPCLRLLRFEFPVNNYFSAYRRGLSPEPPAPTASFVAIQRRDFAVKRYPLSELQYDLLASLCAGQSIAAAVEAHGERLEAAGGVEQLRAWFAEWSAAEFFLRLEHAC